MNDLIEALFELIIIIDSFSLTQGPNLVNITEERIPIFTEWI